MITRLTQLSIPRGLKQVAEKAGVSTMTVSRVMRQSVHVSAETRQRVLDAARSLGYRPDPVASRLMEVVRKGKAKKIGAALAFVRDRRQPSTRESDHCYVVGADIRTRAAVQGYAIDEFSLGVDGLNSRRLRSILAARNIDGVIFSSESSRGAFEDFDFSGFASATFGYGMRVPALHRASTNMMHGLLTVCALLADRGYQRIGLAITPWIDERSDHTYSGAILHYQASIPKRHRVTPLIFRDNDLAGHRQVFCKWTLSQRPDVLISFDSFVPDWLRKHLALRIPEDIGFVVHDWTERAKDYSGICHNRQHVAAAAVDLVTTQLYHNERGIPEVARQVLIPASWIEGGSC